MMGRMTLREVREALAAAKAKGAKAAAKSPTVKELESLARLLEREAEGGVPGLQGAGEQNAAAEGGGRRGSRRSARPRSPRRR
jgi:hypothetical protein